MRTSKYNVKKDKTDRTFDGIVFDSVVEKRYYTEVVLPQMLSGEITQCELQKRYVLQPGFVREGKKILPIYYDADFCITFKNGEELVVDIKGMPNPDAKLKRKLFWYVYPDKNYVWIVYSKKDGGWITYEEKQKYTKERKKLKKMNKKE